MSVLKRDDMKFKPFLNILNVTVDYCSYFDRKGVGAYLIDIVAKDLMAHGNLLQPCPLRGHLYVKNFKIDLSKIWFVTPTGEYFVHVLMYQRFKKTDIYGCDCSGYAEVKSN